jgi:hypothetical protein
VSIVVAVFFIHCSCLVWVFIALLLKRSEERVTQVYRPELKFSDI